VGPLHQLDARPPRGRGREDRLRPLPPYEVRDRRRRHRAQEENQALAAARDKSLSRTKYLWLYSAENLPERHKDRFALLAGPSGLRR